MNPNGPDWQPKDYIKAVYDARSRRTRLMLTSSGSRPAASLLTTRAISTWMWFPVVTIK